MDNFLHVVFEIPYAHYLQLPDQEYYIPFLLYERLWYRPFPLFNLIQSCFFQRTCLERSISSLTSYSSQYLVSCQLFLLIQLTPLGGPGTTWEPFPRPDRPCVCIPILCHLWGLDQLLVTKGRKLSFRSQICNFLTVCTNSRLLCLPLLRPCRHSGDARPSLPAMALFPFHDRLEMFICYRLQWHLILCILLF